MRKRTIIVEERASYREGQGGNGYLAGLKEVGGFWEWNRTQGVAISMLLKRVLKEIPNCAIIGIEEVDHIVR